MNSDTEWRTDDLSLAAYLRCEGHEFVRIELENPGTVPIGYVVFERNEELLWCVEEYVGGDARVEPKDYSRHFGAIKKDVFRQMDDRPRAARSRETQRRAG